MKQGFQLGDLIALLWQQRFRTLSTLFGIAWGTFALVLLISFGRGLELDLQQRARALGKSLVVAWPQQTTLSYAGLPKGRRLRIRADDIMALPTIIPELHSVSAEFQNSDQLQFNGQVHAIRISGVYPSFSALRTLIPESGGRFINPSDLAERRRVVFLGNQIKSEIFGDQAAVGQLLKIRGVPFQVIGVLKPKRQDSDYGGLDADRIYLPATTHAQLFNRYFISNFVFRARDLSSHEAAIDRVYQTLGRQYQFDPRDRAAINLWDTTESDRLFAYFFLGFNSILMGSGLLTLLIGGIGVGNLMYILVKRQTRELAIQMAVGAQPRYIMRQVLAQTMTIVLIGGGLGVSLALGIVLMVRDTAATEQIGDPTISPWLSLMTVAFLLGIGVLAGYFPARRAAQLEPALILSQE